MVRAELLHCIARKTHCCSLPACRNAEPSSGRYGIASGLRCWGPTFGRTPSYAERREHHGARRRRLPRLPLPRDRPPIRSGAPPSAASPRAGRVLIAFHYLLRLRHRALTSPRDQSLRLAPSRWRLGDRKLRLAGSQHHRLLADHHLRPDPLHARRHLHRQSG